MMARREILATLRRALELLVEPASVVELRILGSRRRVSGGYFSDHQKLAAAAAHASGRAAGVYVTVNPVNPALLARAANRLVGGPEKLTGNGDILCRRWFLVDLDPVRASGISATEEEHAAARARADEIEQVLRELGWPAPVVVDSGNGFYLLFRIDLPNDAPSAALVKRCLQALALRFGDSAVSVDESVADAAQLIRVPGTLNVKGDHTQDRPHRVARVLRVPPKVETVSADLLNRLAAMAPDATVNAQTDAHRTDFDIDGWLKEHAAQLRVVQSGPWNGGRKWILNPCPWNPEHTNRAAYIVQLPAGALAAGCHHNSCRGKGWDELRDLLEPRWRDRVQARPPGASASANTDVGKLSQAQRLVRIAEGAELFLARDGETAYATLKVNGHDETWALRSKGFRRWLTQLFYASERRAPSGQALTDALNAIEAQAHSRRVVHDVFIRVGTHAGAIYLDLVNAEWEAIEVTAQGWRIVSNPPVKFRRAKGMQPLPRPVPGGPLEGLRSFLNVGRDTDGDARWKLVVAWIVAATRPTGPYPVLVIGGEQGTAKSTMAGALRRLIDPNTALLRAEPRDGRDLMIAATNGWIIAFDNLSELPTWLSNALCRLSTGGGFSTRELYTDGDETLFEAQRPVILNGIENIVSRSDLLDRCLLLTLPVIDEDARRDEQKFWVSFNEARPQLLAALLEAVSIALARIDTVTLPRLPRMADFAIWVKAAAPALGWADDAFEEVYADHQAGAHELALEASLVAPVVRAFAADNGDWAGTAGELLKILNDQVGEATRRERRWPKDSARLSSALRRLAPNLRAVGVKVEFEDRPELGARRRQLVIKAAKERSERSGNGRQKACRNVANAPNGPNQPPSKTDNGQEDLPIEGSETPELRCTVPADDLWGEVW